jgi:predicted metal-binding membrane protein
LRRDQVVVVGALLLVTALSWAWLLAGAGMEMSAFEMTRHSMMDMPLARPAPWSFQYAVLMFFMWWIMMIAMMLPAATPVILLAAALNRRSTVDTPPYGSSLFFTAGYLLAWGAFSLLATACQWGLERLGLMNAMMVGSNTIMTGLILIIAGLWQFSPLKQACLSHCRSPVEFLSGHRRPGNFGALFMGAHHGLYCLGCCWFLMGLLFVGGVMNLYWILGLVIYVWVEKMMPGGLLVSKLMGVFLIAFGLFTILA